MKLIHLILIMVAVFAINACNQKPAQTEENANVKYYRHLQFSETPWDQEQGLHPISAKDAETINNYKFTWNDAGQLVSVEYNRNEVLLGYSNMGAAKITYTYDGNKQIKRFYNENEEAVKNSGVSVQEYTLDENGTRVALQFLNENGEAVENMNNIHNYKWTELEDDMIQELRFNLAGEEVVMNQFCPFYELRFSYDENGYVTRMANYEEDTLYNCTAENCGDVGVSYFLFENNENGDLLTFSVHNTVGQLSNLYWGWAKRKNIVDENGYVVETSVFDQDDEYLGGRNIPVTKNEYNEHGALVKSISLDKDNNIVNNPNNGVAIVEYKYDDTGRRVETVRYDKDLNPVESNS